MLGELAERKPIFEDEGAENPPDPDEVPITERKLITQPFDLVISSLLDQIDNKTLHLRPISDRPSFQRRYVWSDRLASRFIESILLNVPIPPCYLSQNDDFELDVIDGQQRIYSVYRFVRNQLKLSTLEILKEFNGLRFHELPIRQRRKLETYTLRCVIITNDSHPEIRFDVFERLNTNTMPLNAQELRNCIYRGPLIDLISDLAEFPPWLRVLNRKEPDKRMRGEELILRYFAFKEMGLDTYRTPQKYWLNDAAKEGRGYGVHKIAELEQSWKQTLGKCLMIFSQEEVFRRLPLERPRSPINRALMDVTMSSMARFRKEQLDAVRTEYRRRYEAVLRDEEFDDLITRSIDHKSRTLRRFAIWEESVIRGLV